MANAHLSVSNDVTYNLLDFLISYRAMACFKHSGHQLVE